jgi:hypothetical protein
VEPDELDPDAPPSSPTSPLLLDGLPEEAPLLVLPGMFAPLPPAPALPEAPLPLPEFAPPFGAALPQASPKKGAARK